MLFVKHFKKEKSIMKPEEKIEISLDEAKLLKESLEKLGVNTETIKTFLKEGFVNKYTVAAVGYVGYKIGKRLIKINELKNQREMIDRYAGEAAGDEFEYYSKALLQNPKDDGAREKVRRVLELANNKRSEIISQENSSAFDNEYNY